ncbi:MAG: AAA family ATPase [Elusimicrobia bacterium]|nr:AAA family ATPase [Elusimicrobiota bacterium]
MDTPVGDPKVKTRQLQAARLEGRTFDEIETLIRARYPILNIVSWEEERIEEGLIRIAKKLGKNAFTWSVTRGIAPAGASLQSKKVLTEGTTDPVAGLRETLERVDPSIYIFKDFHPYLSNPEVVRLLRDLAGHLRKSPKTLILLSPQLRIPQELEKAVTVVDMPLPSYAEIGKYLDDLAVELKEKGKIRVALDAGARERLIKALAGLTMEEAENVLAKSVIMRGILDESALPSVLTEKKQTIRKSGVLEYIDYEEGLAGVGGLKFLKDWFARRNLAFTDKARAFGLPAPKGALLIGVQGCGKSLCAKTVAAAWKQPLLRLDVSRIFSSLVGSSESNVRHAIMTAESVAPAVLWVDEIDKAFAGVQSSTFSDSGTTARVFGGFISWLQEKTAPVFVIATANNISNLPPELMRKGRFDEIFFVDLPVPAERADIFSIHLRKRGRDPAVFDPATLAAQCEGFSGAEIEQAVLSGLYAAFEAGRELTAADLRTALRETVPLSKTMSEKIDEMRAWAKGRARPAG